MTLSQYIQNNNKEEFFTKDINEKIRKTENDKCKMILFDMFEKKNLVGLIILSEFVI